MSTDSTLHRSFKAAHIGFLADPTSFVVRLYPATNQPPELVFVPLLKNGQEAGRWENVWLTDEQYDHLVDAVRSIIAPTPVCEVRALPGEAEQSTASTSHPGATPEAEVS